MPFFKTAGLGGRLARDLSARAQPIQISLEPGLNKGRVLKDFIFDKLRNKLGWFGVGLGILYWFFESLIEKAGHRPANLMQFFVPANRNIMGVRLSVLILFTLFGIFVDVLIHQERKAAKKNEWLRQYNELILNSAAEGIFGLDLQGRIAFINPAGASMLGYRPGQLLKKHAHEILSCGPQGPPNFISEDECPVSRILSGSRGHEASETVYRKKDGSHLPAVYTATPIYAGKEIAGVVVSFKDITERKESEAKLRARERQQAAIAEMGQRALSGSGMDELLAETAILVGLTLGVDCSEVLELQPGGEELLVKAGVGWPIEAPGSFRINADETAPHGYALLTGEAVAIEDISAQNRFAFPAGHPACGLASSICVPVEGKDSKRFGVLGAHTAKRRAFNEDDLCFLKSAANVLAEAYERMSTEKQVWLLSYYDSLTGLPNRHLFNERFNQTLAHARRHREQAAVLFLDLDRFKSVNETLGHEKGDMLLKRISQRILGCLREEDSISRQGGDEFIIVLSNIEGPQNAAKTARKILDALTRACLLEGHEFYLTGSIGISLYPSDGNDSEALIRNAHSAMYHVKEQGKNSFQFYASHMNAASSERIRLEGNLRKAIEKDEFVLYYQPQIDLASGEMAGMEALLRWMHPELGLVSPMDFIPLAEETGLIVPIGEWVLKTACRQGAQWRKAGCQPVRIAVNLSMRQFKQREIVQTIKKIVEESGLEPGCLELELTESTLMQDAETVIGALHEFQRMGIHLSLDDFGTGYASLSYLKRLPIDRLKLDKSFVHAITVDPDNEAISKAVIALAHDLDMKVVAEGVETRNQLDLLRSLGCDEVQGFYFQKPVPAGLVF